MDALLRRRLLMQPQGGEIVPPSNQIWYDAESKVSLYTSINVVSHTFSNGRGIVTFKNNLNSTDLWFHNSAVTAIYLPNSIIGISNMSFSGCSKLESISLPEGLTSIGDSAFDSDLELVLNELPIGITRVEKRVFYGCKKLNLSSLPEGLTFIGEYAFREAKLTITSLPSGVTSISQSAFYNCKGITSLTIPIVIPPTLGSAVFYNTSFPIYVPAESLNTYKAATNWSSWKSRIFAIPE